MRLLLASIVSLPCLFLLTMVRTNDGLPFALNEERSTDSLSPRSERRNLPRIAFDTLSEFGDAESVTQVVPHQGRRRHRQGRGRKARRKMANMRSQLRRMFMEQNGGQMSAEGALKAHQLTDEQKKLISGQSLRDLKPSSLPKPVFIAKASHLKRKDWCKTEPLKQRITEKGCVPRTILNNFCYGQCNSFFIPKAGQSPRNGTSGAGPNESFGQSPDTAFKSCAFCKPKKFRWVSIRLHCPSLAPPFRRKRVMLIEKCRCQTQILE